MTGASLEVPEIVRLRDLVDLGGPLLLVDGDGESLDLVLNPTLPRRDFDPHALEEPGKIAEWVETLRNFVETFGSEGPRLDGERRRGDLGDAPQIREIEIPGALLRQAGTNARAEHRRIERFGEVVVGTERKTPRDALGAIHCR